MSKIVTVPVILANNIDNEDRANEDGVGPKRR
jgi:hypothetical protein